MINAVWLLATCVATAAVGASKPALNLDHYTMAHCIAFYTWEARIADAEYQSEPLRAAARRVNARLAKEIGPELANVMAATAFHTWEQFSSVVSDDEWERLAKVYHPSCLAWQ